MAEELRDGRCAGDATGRTDNLNDTDYAARRFEHLAGAGGYGRCAAGGCASIVDRHDYGDATGVWNVRGAVDEAGSGWAALDDGTDVDCGCDDGVGISPRETSVCVACTEDVAQILAESRGVVLCAVLRSDGCGNGGVMDDDGVSRTGIRHRNAAIWSVRHSDQRLYLSSESEARVEHGAYAAGFSAVIRVARNRDGAGDVGSIRYCYRSACGNGAGLDVDLQPGSEGCTATHVQKL